MVSFFSVSMLRLLRRLHAVGSRTYGAHTFFNLGLDHRNFGDVIWTLDWPSQLGLGC